MSIMMNNPYRRNELYWDPLPRSFGYDPNSIEDFMSTASALANQLTNAFLPVDQDRRHDGRAHIIPTVGKQHGFEVKVDVHGYTPEELDVKTMDNFVMVKGQHEEKRDEHGFLSRQFTRRYVLPDGVKPETLNCSLSSDGFLVLSAPILAIEETKIQERPIPITLSGKPALTHKPTQEMKDKEPIKVKTVEQVLHNGA